MRARAVALLAVVAGACGEPRSAARRPACEAGQIVLLGACLDAPPPAPTCGPGEALELEREVCLTRRQTRSLAHASGVLLADHEDAACLPEDELVASVSIGRVACVPRRLPGGRCPAGSVAERGRCAALFTDDAIDLARWAPAAVEELCRELERAPSVVAGGGPLELALAVRVPDNDPTQATVEASSVPAIPEGELSRASARLDDALRRAGRVASASDVGSRIRCERRASRPHAAAAANAADAADAAPPEEY